MMLGIKEKATDAAKRAGLLSGGFLLCLVGTGFLTLAAWLFLSATFAPTEAAIILAGVFLGTGLVLIGIGRRGKSAHRNQKVPQPPPAEMAPLMQAFVFGMKAGADAKQMRSK
jgi:putative superfamily III holin-X